MRDVDFGNAGHGRRVRGIAEPLGHAVSIDLTRPQYEDERTNPELLTSPSALLTSDGDLGFLSVMA